jgi:formylglycine-generating enzyme required for sulfatase activity/energy-coupling factor transporter ATP-binding protein EcfA2
MMSEKHENLLQQIAALEAILYTLQTEDLRAPLLATLQALKAQAIHLGDSVEGDKVGQDKVGGDKVVEPQGRIANHGNLHGNAIGINLGTVQAFFGGKQSEDGERLLTDYLLALEQECQQLHLARLTGRRQSGAEQQATPPLRLQAVYTSLTTDGPSRKIYKPRKRSAQYVMRLIERAQLSEYSHDKVSPEHIRLARLEIASKQFEEDKFELSLFGIDLNPNVEQPNILEPNTLLSMEVVRPELVLEAISTHHRLVLLGEPGHGKSTVLRYLALLLSRQLRNQTDALLGWSAEDVPVPILLPLGRVAAEMARHDGDPHIALWQVLGDVLEGPEGLRSGLRDYLKPAMRNGAVLLCCDGLDELPVDGADGGIRTKVAMALRRLARNIQSRIVITSRVLPYRAAHTWQLPSEEGWHERTIQPLAFGQVRVFVQGWYRALAASSHDLSDADAQIRSQGLIDELEQNERLRPLVQSPLLLTMLAILHANSRDGEIPRERVRLYEECVQLLLERWEPVRTPGLQRPGLIERLGNLPGLEIDKLRDVIHELAFQAHDQPPDDDGRGRIDRHRLRGRLLSFFERIGSTDITRNITTFLEVIRTDAGLLVARDDESAYMFPHLTFQEFLAACYLADQANMAIVAYSRWQSDDRERWRTILLLLAGRLRQKGQKDVERDGVPWLQLLTGSTLYSQPKPMTQRRHDTVLAALSYAELGGRAALSTSMRDLVTQVEIPLQAAIVELLETHDPAISTADRIAAAQVLGNIGDTRFPVMVAEWEKELTQRNEVFGKPDGYWCYVRSGIYQIGGWGEAEPSANIALSAFWIARFPITVAQFELFIKKGYGANAKDWWTEDGWRWKENTQRTAPRGWKQDGSNQSNRPVIGITWYEANAFCQWLNVQLHSRLPHGYRVRIPTEAEWEIATSYDQAMKRSTYPWGGDEPSLDRAIYVEHNQEYPVAVGCCPLGIAACGAMDMVGNVWELTTSRFSTYPYQSDIRCRDFTLDDWDVPRRGGSNYDHSISLQSRTRYKNPPDDDFSYFGFRVVLTTH